MQESLIIVSIVEALIGLVVLPILLYLIFKRELKPFKRVSEIATAIFDDYGDEQKVQVSGLIESLPPLVEAANRVNVVLTNKEALDGFMISLANQLRKSFIAGLLGDASGDSKRMAKADKLVNGAIIDMMGQIHPLLPIAAEKLGLREWIDEDPKMFDAIIATIAGKGGVLNMFKTQNPDLIKGLGDSGSLATPDGGRGEY